MSEIIGQAAPVSNTVRTDMARAAALAVRQAKAGLRAVRAEVGGQRSEIGNQKTVSRGGAESAEGAKRFVWVTGANDRHCPRCAALAGQVRTMAEWEAAGETPGSTELLCGGNCRCQLVEF